MGYKQIKQNNMECFVTTNTRKIKSKRVMFYYVTSTNRSTVKELHTQEDWTEAYHSIHHIRLKSYDVLSIVKLNERTCNEQTRTNNSLSTP